jgi:hypothetical protein
MRRRWCSLLRLENIRDGCGPGVVGFLKSVLSGSTRPAYDRLPTPGYRLLTAGRQQLLALGAGISIPAVISR